MAKLIGSAMLSANRGFDTVARKAKPEKRQSLGHLIIDEGCPLLLSQSG